MIHGADKLSYLEAEKRTSDVNFRKYSQGDIGKPGKKRTPCVKNSSNCHYRYSKLVC
jgi:hypothetical protein